MFFEYIILSTADITPSHIGTAVKTLKQHAPVEPLGFNERGYMVRTPRRLTREETALSGAILHTNAAA